MQEEDRGGYRCRRKIEEDIGAGGGDRKISEQEEEIRGYLRRRKIEEDIGAGGRDWKI